MIRGDAEKPGKHRGMKRQSWMRRFGITQRLKFSLSDASAWLPDTGLLYRMASNLRIISRLSGSPCSPSPQQSNVKPKKALITLQPSPQSPSHMFSCFLAWSFLREGNLSGNISCHIKYHYIYRAFYIINGDNNSLEHSFNSRNPWSLNIKQWSIHACLVTPSLPPKDPKRICWICTV